MIDRKEKPFPCPYCQSLFSREDLINRHVRKFHPDAPLVERPRRRKPGKTGETDEEFATSLTAFENQSDDSPEQHMLVDVGGLSDLQQTDLSNCLGGFDLLAVASTLTPDTPFSNLAVSMNHAEMPLERTWLAFHWFSDFFKDLTEAAASENLIARKVPPIDALSTSAGNKCKPITQEDVSTLYDRIMELEKSNRLSLNFSLPSELKLSRYMCGYFGYFNPHTPIVHTQSFEFSTISRTPSIFPMLTYSTNAFVDFGDRSKICKRN